MSQAFDTGLSKSTYAAIRDALVARLELLKRTAAPALYLVSVATVARPMRGQGDEDGLGLVAMALKGQAPSVAVALGRSQVETIGLEAVDGREQIEFSIFVASSHQAGREDGRLYGDAASAASNSADPGIFTMLQHVRELVHGQSLEIDGVSEPRWSEQDEVFTGDDATIWEQKYTVLAEVSINPDRSVTEVLESIQAQHRLDGVPDGVEPDPDDPDPPDPEADLDPIITTLAAIDP